MGLVSQPCTLNSTQRLAVLTMSTMSTKLILALYEVGTLVLTIASGVLLGT